MGKCDPVICVATGLPGEDLVDPTKAQQITQLLGAVTIVVTTSDHAVIPTPLRATSRPDAVPVIKQPKLLGILCGTEVGNLVVVGFKHEDDLVSFINANLELETSPVTLWNGWFLIWFRTEFLPASQVFDGAEMFWAANGVIPVGWLGKQAEAVRVSQPGFPKVISYIDLRWPVSASAYFRFEYFRSLHGNPYLPGKRKTTLNMSFWAAWLTDRLRLSYDSQLEAFLHTTRPGEDRQTLGAGQVNHLVISALQETAKLDRKHFPVTEIRAKRIRELIDLMAVMDTRQIPGSEAEGLMQYLGTCITEREGAKFTTEENWQHYKSFCAKHGLPTYPKCEFLRITPQRIRQRFGRTRVHSVGRHRGYNGLALVVQPEAPASDRTSATTQTAPLAGTPSAAASVSAGSPILQEKDGKDAGDGKDVGMCMTGGA